jgi:hypothetical protein
MRGGSEGDEMGPPGKFLKNLLIKMQYNPKWCNPLRFCPKSIDPTPGILATI